MFWNLQNGQEVFVKIVRWDIEDTQEGFVFGQPVRYNIIVGIDKDGNAYDTDHGDPDYMAGYTDRVYDANGKAIH